MYTMVRTYSGKAAPQLYNLLMDHKDEVKDIMGKVKGLEHYDVIKTSDGCCTVSTCADKAAADETMSKAKSWLKDNAGHLGQFTPTVFEGPVSLHM